MGLVGRLEAQCLPEGEPHTQLCTRGRCPLLVALRQGPKKCDQASNSSQPIVEKGHWSEAWLFGSELTGFRAGTVPSTPPTKATSWHGALCLGAAC